MAVGQKVPLETCEACGKTIARDAQAHVVDGRIVCYRCMQKINAEKNAAEADRLAAIPSDRQIAFAAELGIALPADVTSQELSRLISDHLNPPPSQALCLEAMSYGIGIDEHTRTTELEDLLGDYRSARCWFYSVCRHITKAKWVRYSDSSIPPQAALPVIRLLAQSDDMMDAIDEQWSAPAPDWFYDEVYRRGIEDEDEWVSFGVDGASSRTKVFQQTKAMIEARFRFV